MALSAVFGGATLPQLPAAMRSVWSTLADGPAQRETAYAVVSITFEIAVVTAPALVALLVTVASPAVAVIAAATLGTGAAVAFTFTGASRGWRGARHEVGWLGPLTTPGMRTVVAVLAAFGMAVGVVQVAVPAFAAARGSAAAGGVLLAALSLGSLVGGLVYGAHAWPGRPPGRLAAVMSGIGVAFALLALSEAPITLAALLVLAGLLFAPATVIGSTLLDTVAPPGTMTEAFTVMVMAIVAGIAAGSAIGGTLVESASFDATVIAAATIAAAGSAVALLRRKTLA